MSASGVSIVNGRIAVASADFSVMTAMWAPDVGAYGADRLRSYAYTGRVSGAGKNRPPRVEARRTRTVHPGRHRAQAALRGRFPRVRLGPTGPSLGPTGPSMSYRETEHLRVLIANERKDRLALVAPIVTGLGHEVVAREIDVNEVGPATTREGPDVALVGLGESSDH